MELFPTKIFLLFFIVDASTAQEANAPEISNQFDKITLSEEIHNKSVNSNIIEAHNEIIEEIDDANQTYVAAPKTDAAQSVYKILLLPLKKILSSDKVNTVLHNIGTCVVNGVMEIVAYYFPAPIIPLIASAAGMVIPFEPIVMLRRRMPVTSYRRAFKTAVNGFLNTFDSYKVDNYDDDPYMTRRFNRRFMNDDSKEIKKDDT